METIKFATGISIIAIGFVIIALIALIQFCKISRPAFLIDNIPEIIILTVVSMLMGLVLIVS